MGAKQSKRSVDISGKEAEGAGEVAAAGAGGEGRVEQLADADSLKPQINGDAHIHDQTDKEKQLDCGTPENEKDATTEKEGKEQDNDKEESPVTNGDTEQTVENGESAPAPEDAKKPKKEKVKKKWSLRSISFSRKDKPKQEKKQKEEEPKTNGEPEKLPEETAESTAESTVNEVAEEAKPQPEEKEEKAPETPVTEPITNGSTTPESPKAEIALSEESVAVNPENDRPEPKADTEPEQLPVNGLSLEDPKTPEFEKSEVRKPEEPTTETAEVVPEPEITVKKEVCVEQMPLIEPSPPPLPANPPPSSVASFAATTMAPELTDASLANTAENAVIAQPTVLDTKDSVNEISPKPQITLTNIETISTELPPPFKETSDENPVDIDKAETTKNEILVAKDLSQEIPEVESVLNEVDAKIEDIPEQILVENSNSEVEESVEQTTDAPQAIKDLSPLACENITIDDVKENNESPKEEININKEIVVNSNHISDTAEINGFDKTNLNENVVTDQENIKNKTDSLGKVIEATECNGNAVEQKPITKEEITIETVQSAINTEEANEESGKAVTTPEDSMPPSLSDTGASNDASESFPLPPSELCRSECEPSPAASPSPTELTSPTEPTSPITPISPISPADAATLQDPIPVCDKLAEIIPEVVAIPELITETLQETTCDVAVAN